MWGYNNPSPVQLVVVHSQTSTLVTVQDAFGSKIPNAQITVKDGLGNSLPIATTDSNGQATLNGISGTWTYTVSAAGYVTNTGTWQILAAPYTNSEVVYLATAPQATVYFTVKKGGVSGTIYIPNALIAVKDGAGNSKTATTDSSGKATIIGISGTWQYTVSATGYFTNTGTIAASDTTYTTIFLYSTSLGTAYSG